VRVSSHFPFLSSNIKGTVHELIYWSDFPREPCRNSFSSILSCEPCRLPQPYPGLTWDPSRTQASQTMLWYSLLLKLRDFSPSSYMLANVNSFFSSLGSYVFSPPYASSQVNHSRSPLLEFLLSWVHTSSSEFSDVDASL